MRFLVCLFARKARQPRSFWKPTLPKVQPNDVCIVCMCCLSRFLLFLLIHSEKLTKIGHPPGGKKGPMLIEMWVPWFYLIHLSAQTPAGWSHAWSKQHTWPVTGYRFQWPSYTCEGLWTELWIYQAPLKLWQTITQASFHLNHPSTLRE